MYTIDCVKAKENFDTLIEMTTAEKRTIEINTANEVVLLINKKEYEAILETAYLCANPHTKQVIIDGLQTPLSECEELNWETI